MSVNEVVVVGGGITGSVAAIALAQRGVQVTLVEKVQNWQGVGHGITVQGNALKTFERIGALPAMLSHGHPLNTVEVCHADGHVMVTIDTPRTGGPDLPATMGALRSDLQSVLVSMIADLGIATRLGVEMESFTDHGDHVEAHLSDGTSIGADLIITADGIKATSRGLLGIPEDKAPTGMGIWRVVTKRTPDMDTSAIYYHGEHYKAGFTPISDDLCYAYVLTDPIRPDNGLTDIETMRGLLSSYHGHFDHIRESLTEGDNIGFQPIEWLFVQGPWHRGRVIAIGDAVHACPPLIAQGAAQCSEDAWLLAQYVTDDDVVDTASLDAALGAYESRRKPRVKIVVDASLQLVDWELHPDAPGADPAGLMASSLAALTEEA